MPDRPGLVERLGKTLLDWDLTPEEVTQAVRAALDGANRPLFLPRPRLSVV